MKRRLTNTLVLSVITAMLASANDKPISTGTVATPQEIKQSLSNPAQPLTLVHIWATWCGPCREEFPELLQAYQATRDNGLALQLISADDPGDMETVNRFLAEQQSPVGTLVASELNQDFIELFSKNWSGALPASFFFDAEGNLLAEWQGKRSSEEYIATIHRLLQQGKE